MTEASLAGRVAWVTGSSRGLGRVMAEHLGRLGADLVVHGTTQTSARAFGEGESLDQVARDVAATTGRRVLAVPADLTRPEAVQAAVARIRAEYGRIDVLVNNAGGDIGPAGATGPGGGRPPNNDAVFIALEDLRAVIDRNLLSCIYVCREVAPEMIERRAGRIVNLGSVAGLNGRAEGAMYATAKAGRARVHALPRRAAPAVQRHGQLRGAGRHHDASLRRDGSGAGPGSWSSRARFRATASRRTLPGPWSTS